MPLAVAVDTRRGLFYDIKKPIAPIPWESVSGQGVDFSIAKIRRRLTW
jgi:hypothetical protein